jgi:hypothetical protein
MSNDHFVFYLSIFLWRAVYWYNLRKCHSINIPGIKGIIALISSPIVEVHKMPEIFPKDPRLIPWTKICWEEIILFSLLFKINKQLVKINEQLSC